LIAFDPSKNSCCTIRRIFYEFEDTVSGESRGGIPPFGLPLPLEECPHPLFESLGLIGATLNRDPNRRCSAVGPKGGRGMYRDNILTKIFGGALRSRLQKEQSRRLFGQLNFDAIRWHKRVYGQRIQVVLYLMA